MQRLTKWWVGVLMLVACNVFAQNVSTYIPTNAHQHLAPLRAEAERLAPTGPPVAYYASLIEQESCIGLKHSKCWSSKSKLKTSREEGAGLSQITRAYYKNGDLRFDKLTEMRDQYRSELKELSWENVYYRDDLQYRIVILLTMENWRKLFAVKSLEGRLAMTDSAYNGGYRDVARGREICGLRENCNPDIWFDNVERTLPKSTKPIYGNRSAKDINLEHVHNVLKVRYQKYDSFYSKKESLHVK